MLPLQPGTLEPVPWDMIKEKFAGVGSMSKEATVTGTFDQKMVTLKWVTDIGVIGGCTVNASEADKPSVLASENIAWDEFKRRPSLLNKSDDFLFRGQSEPWRLRTAFHWHGRYDLRRFKDYDIPHLHRHLSARTRHFFDLNEPFQNGAFVSLVQHHGYPTNLLDWTRSPAALRSDPCHRT